MTRNIFRGPFVLATVVSLFFILVFSRYLGAAEIAVPPPASAAWTPDPEVLAQIASDPALVQRKLEAAMRRLLNNPKSLVVELTPSMASGPVTGNYSKITVKAVKGEIDKLVLNKADLEFIDVNLNTTKLVQEEKIDTVSVKLINMNVSILESDMNQFLREKSGKIKVDNPKVQMNPGKIVVSGSTKYGFVRIKFWATGEFAVKDSKEIYFHPRRLRINGVGMPKPFVGSVVRRINPVMNLKKFPFQLNLKAIQIKEGELLFTSSGDGK